MECQLQIHKWVVAQQLQIKSTSIRFTMSEKEWLTLHAENKHEVKIHGNMFDVSSVVHSNGCVELNGQFDSFEDELLRSVAGLLNMNVTDHENSSIVLLFQSLYFEENGFKLILSPFESARVNQHYLITQTKLLNRYQGVDIPPPKFS